MHEVSRNPQCRVSSLWEDSLFVQSQVFLKHHQLYMISEHFIIFFMVQLFKLIMLFGVFCIEKYDFNDKLCLYEICDINISFSYDFWRLKVLGLRPILFYFL
ncbi:hypothetical protein Scep_027778 [Stephania cephalantha]|uniref:Uncharacterized protein n=1 Tax=Stephania cephalantha TaxID=152367 RepID=A0AAP0HLF6_9MAGN